MTSDELENPYVGLRPFDTNHAEAFFGREQETHELFSLVVAYPTVLILGKSGVGKTSMVRAGLIPQLQRRLRSPANISYSRTVQAIEFLETALQDFTEDLPDERYGRAQTQAHQSIAATEENDARLHVVIFDQLEEVFVAQFRQKANELFRSIQQALDRDLMLRVVLVLREEFLAATEKHAGTLGLPVRLHVEGFEPDAASRAIVNPSRAWPVRWDGEAVDSLVKDLVSTSEDGLVNPVLLQLAARAAWQHANANGAPTIGVRSLRGLNGPTGAITRWVRGAVESVAIKASIDTAVLYSRIEKTLITSQGTRAIVSFEQAHEGGLPKDVLMLLASAYVVRLEWRNDSALVELFHDLLIQPIASAGK